MEYVTTAQAARILAVSKSRVDQFCREGLLPFETLGQMRLILKADVRKLKSVRSKKARGKS